MNLLSTEEYLQNMSDKEFRTFLSKIPAIQQLAADEQKNNIVNKLFKEMIPNHLIGEYYLSEKIDGQAEHDLAKWCVYNLTFFEIQVIMDQLNIAPHVWTKYLAEKNKKPTN